MGCDICLKCYHVNSMLFLDSSENQGVQTKLMSWGELAPFIMGLVGIGPTRPSQGANTPQNNKQTIAYMQNAEKTSCEDTPEQAGKRQDLAEFDL